MTSRRQMLAQQREASDPDRLKPPMSAVLTHYDISYMPGWGGWQSILCPFHNESNASFSVNVDAGKFKCHGCGIGGDVWSFIMAKEEIPKHEFVTAVRLAEEWTGNSYSRVPGSAQLGSPGSRDGEDVPFEQVSAPRHKRRVPTRRSR